jgi:hypothetical protein
MVGTFRLPAGHGTAEVCLFFSFFIMAHDRSAIGEGRDVGSGFTYARLGISTGSVGTGSARPNFSAGQQGRQGSSCSIPLSLSGRLLASCCICVPVSEVYYNIWHSSTQKSKEEKQGVRPRSHVYVLQQDTIRRHKCIVYSINKFKGLIAFIISRELYFPSFYIHTIK